MYTSQPPSLWDRSPGKAVRVPAGVDLPDHRQTLEVDHGDVAVGRARDVHAGAVRLDLQARRAGADGNALRFLAVRRIEHEEIGTAQRRHEHVTPVGRELQP